MRVLSFMAEYVKERKGFFQCMAWQTKKPTYHNAPGLEAVRWLGATNITFEDEDLGMA